MPKILIIGGTGQLGIELLRHSWRQDVEIVAPARAELNLVDAAAVHAFIDRVRPDCVINAAAFTAVDAAEDDAAEAILANCQGPACLAEASAGTGTALVQVSTDYVFGGDGTGSYGEDDPIDPIGVYGASKAAGELAVRAINPRAVVVRTAWVLSAHRSNFLKTMLRLAAGRPSLRVVADQRGCPTSAADLAAALATIALRLVADAASPVGIYHFINSGDASWYELAVEVFRLSNSLGGPTAEVAPITTAEFPTRAKRPANSSLSTSKIERDYGITSRNWRAAAAEIIAELDRSGELKEFVR